MKTLIAVQVLACLLAAAQESNPRPLALATCALPTRAAPKPAIE